MRFYAIAGVRFSHDFASNESTERGPLKPLIALKKNSVYYEYGFGFDYFLIYNPLSIEFKMSNSFTNLLSTDPYIYSSSIGRLQGRLFQVSLHFQ
ncbi:MAG: hypothetical protein H7321_06675 [Bacteroidia bacterium]|nr:hypothetical protein [Bacteroidia bacterium]